VLEPEAGAFSVPSKILTYLCAARPLLVSVPAENLAARIVKRSNAGFVVEPGDSSGFLAAAEKLGEDVQLRAEFAGRARAYAETAFDIASLSGRFEQVLERARGATS
jgi:glycosyltransferase involved in cell wall biosynthesis